MTNIFIIFIFIQLLLKKYSFSISLRNFYLMYFDYLKDKDFRGVYLPGLLFTGNVGVVITS